MAQSKDPSRHSWASPRNKIKKKVALMTLDIIAKFFNMAMGIGRRMAISMSNTKKITANKKKRKEKGVRAEFLGSNPHSKGLIFSRSAFVRLVSSLVKDSSRQDKITAISKLKINKFIKQEQGTCFL